ncbi:MAG: hypothetical protein E6Q91_03280 [Actinobacteria bacterium]|jgi:hypothetical protein|nr:hypothetical protein [Actinomycetota bacterium]TXH31332.1 MAG: hypothetical protein E6Q91_03280 [Actinomycetota bacterium]
MSTAEETPEVVDTDPAQRPSLSESWPAIARLAFISVYSLTIIIAGFGHWGPSTVRVLNAVVAVLWVLLLIMWIRQVRDQTGRFSFVLRHPALPMLLIAPLFLILFWDPVWFIVIVVAFILELRQLSAGDGFTFSFVLILFVGVMSGLTMVELENNQQSSGIHGLGDAFGWAFGGLLHIDTGNDFAPTTSDGKFLGVVVSVCGILAASMFTAKLVAWILGNEESPSDESVLTAEDAEALRAEVAELRATVSRLNQTIQQRAGGSDPN